MTVRVLGRTHLEAWFTALYMHFGGYDAVARIAQYTSDQREKTDEDVQRFNRWLADQKKSAQNSIKKVRATNEVISHWNRENPDPLNSYTTSRLLRN
jgi:ABC-type Zn2+ transport system substrate-binding protein/surface adhesin